MRVHVLSNYQGTNAEFFFWLQDQVPPFPSGTAVSIVEEQLRAPLNDIFDRFDYEPIAAASLGNLNLPVMLSHGGI